MESMVLTLGRVSTEFWSGKKVFLTGHTGFKGGWLTFWLHLMGARVAGYALAPNTAPCIFDALELESLLDESHIADIRDLNRLSKAIESYQPDVVIHMAAQPLVRQSYAYPLETYEVNVMGTAYLLEALRNASSVKATVIITTDKCYENKEREAGYTEDEPMGGYDPYSSSKGCAELVTSAYRRSFFNSINNKNFIASARAGNVIGGGDWSSDRLIPDAIRAFQANHALVIRNPRATRPWQHVLEPLSGYLVLAQSLFENGKVFSSGWNFGPDESDTRSVQEVIELFIKLWGHEASWKQDPSAHPHEAHLLSLSCLKSKTKLNWQPSWNLETALEKIVDWHHALAKGDDMRALTKKQIEDYQIHK
jgi:CDP-glucose 4,6-dehydratase